MDAEFGGRARRRLRVAQSATVDCAGCLVVVYQRCAVGWARSCIDGRGAREVPRGCERGDEQTLCSLVDEGGRPAPKALGGGGGGGRGGNWIAGAMGRLCAIGPWALCDSFHGRVVRRESGHQLGARGAPRAPKLLLRRVLLVRGQVARTQVPCGVKGAGGRGAGCAK